MTSPTMRLLLLLATHFLSDFLLQPRAMAKGKSEKLPWLAGHLLITYLCFMWVGPIFAMINMLVHGVIDWYIWRGYKKIALWRGNRQALAAFKPDPNDHPAVQGAKLEKHKTEWLGGFKYWEDSLFYDTIGFDQLLHISTLVILNGLHYV